MRLGGTLQAESVRIDVMHIVQQSPLQGPNI